MPPTLTTKNPSRVINRGKHAPNIQTVPIDEGGRHLLFRPSFIRILRGLETGWSPKGKTDPRFFPNVCWRENTDPVPYAREREGKGAKGMGNRTATMIGWK